MKTIEYIKCGDYYIPDLKLPEQALLPLGKYGRMRLNYLRENSPYLYNNHLLNGTLNKHCSETEAKAEARLSELIEATARAEGVTEALKAANPLLIMLTPTQCFAAVTDDFFKLFKEY